MKSLSLTIADMFRRRLRQFSRLPLHIKIFILITVLPLIYVCHYFNVIAYLMTEPFSKLKYPLDVDMPQVVDQVLHNQKPEAFPINAHNYPVVIENDRKCKTEDGDDQSIFLTFVIKSALKNFALRDVIRRTWGHEYLIPSLLIRRVFVLGIKHGDPGLQQKIALEAQKHEDIIQEYFVDHYYNNTIKLVAGLRWVTQFCRGSQYVVFMDDDYYVSTHNIVRLLTPIPDKLQTNLVIGYIWKNAMPFRGTYSKWRITLEEYPYRFWPPYPTAGSFITSMEIAEKLFIASQYTRYIRFDDVFVGILLWKLHIKPIHNEHFHFHREPYNRLKYKDVLAMHDIKNPQELNQIFVDQERYRRLKEKIIL